VNRAREEGIYAVALLASSHLYRNLGTGDDLQEAELFRVEPFGVWYLVEAMRGWCAFLPPNVITGRHEIIKGCRHDWIFRVVVYINDVTE
jgi:hypothetical protein